MKEIKGFTSAHGESMVKVYFPDNNRAMYEVVFLCRGKILSRLHLITIRQLALLEECLTSNKFGVTPRQWKYSKEK